MRLAWFIGSLVMGALLAYGTYDAIIGAVIDIFGLSARDPLAQSIEQSRLVRAAGMVSLFAAYAALLHVLIVGLFDAVKNHSVLNDLEDMVEQKALGKVLKQKAFLDIFVNSGLNETAAQRFVSQFDHNAAGEAKKAEPDFTMAQTSAAQYYTPSSLLEAALFYWFFKPLPLLVLGVSAVCFLLILVGDASQAGAEEAANPFYHDLRIGIIALAFGLAGATIVEAFTAMIGAFRRTQIRRLAEHVDRLFVFGSERVYFTRLINATDAHSVKITEGVVKLADNIGSAIDKSGKNTVKAVETANENTANQIAKSIEVSLSGPLKTLAASTKALTGDQSAQVRKLLDATLKGFIDQLASHLGGQVKEISQFLKSASDVSAKAEKSFVLANATIAKQTDEQLKALNASFMAALKTLSQFEERNRKALTKDLDGLVKALNSEVAGHSKDFGKLVEKGLKDVKETAETTLYGAEANMQTAAASLDGLQETIESLTTLVTPILRQVIDNQEGLLSAIESDASSSKAISRAANQMSAASQASRETVERFITLAERLREISRTLQSDGRKGAAGGKERNDELSKAIKELKSSARDLPKL